jgi:hypothetical protein
MIEAIKQIEETELTIERLEVVWECTEDYEIKEIITTTILRLQMLLNDICQRMNEQKPIIN